MSDESNAFLEIVRQHYASMPQENSAGLTQDMLAYKYLLYCDVCGQARPHKALPDVGRNERYMCVCGMIKSYAVR